MGSGASKASATTAEACADAPEIDDTYPNGPLGDAPAALTVAFGAEPPLVFSKCAAAWNRKAMYEAPGGLKLFYRACVGWQFDARPPAATEGDDDWAAGGEGWIGVIDGGPAFPPLGPGVPLNGGRGGAPRSVAVAAEGRQTPHVLYVACHPSERACGDYEKFEERRGFPAYRNAGGWTLAFDGEHWAFFSGVTEDPRDGGWIGPFCWSHPPTGDCVPLNGLDDAFVFGKNTVVVRPKPRPAPLALPPPSPRASPKKSADLRPAPPAAAPAAPPVIRKATVATKALDTFSAQIDAVDLKLGAKIVDELLTQIACKIDGVETAGEADARAYRKRLIKRIDAITAAIYAPADGGARASAPAPEPRPRSANAASPARPPGPASKGPAVSPATGMRPAPPASPPPRQGQPSPAATPTAGGKAPTPTGKPAPTPPRSKPRPPPTTPPAATLSPAAPAAFDLKY